MGSRPQHDPAPPYDQSLDAPILLAETTTTRTEVVTTTTHTTHFFSLPPWKKRSPQQARPKTRDGSTTSLDSRRVSTNVSSILFDKSLPPTPSNESKTVWDRVPSGASPSHSPIPPQHTLPRVPTKKHSFDSRRPPQLSLNHTPTVLAHAALGLGFPHASGSSTGPQHSPLTPSSDALATRKIRKVKSFHRPRSRKQSTPAEFSMGDSLPPERQRRLSFSATNIFSLASAGPTAKAPPSERTSPIPGHAPSKPLSRRSSFWLKKKDADPPQPPPLPVDPSQPDDIVLTLPPLPLIHQMSPMDLSHLISPAQNDKAEVERARPISRSHSDSAELYLQAAPRSRLQPITPFPCTIDPADGSQPRASADVPSSHPLPQPRARAQTNPPILHRLSLGAFSPSSDSPRNRTPVSPQTFPRTPRRPDIQVPKPLSDDESPQRYLERLMGVVSKAEIAGVLASSSDSFYTQALRVYISQFDFANQPLDIALRKLLMEVGLPRETQQIDRVIEAFAACYVECNPNSFVSNDHPYILAFSLIMLHTDAFNRSNKRKMTKPDYIKNTSIPGISVELLDCFYDNIVFAPFIFIEDPVDINGQPGLSPDASYTTPIQSPVSALPTSTSLAPFKIGTKVDPYYLITNNLLDSLRVDVEAYLPVNNPFSYEGTAGPWDEPSLHRAFVNASVIEVDAPTLDRSNAVFATPGATPAVISSLGEPYNKVLTLKITKIGVLVRKDDMSTGGKRATNRKWRSWSTVLTGSQLLLFRDPTWASTLQPLLDQNREDPSLRGPPTELFRPDEIISVKDSVAVFDKSYKKYPHTFRLVLHNGRQLLMRATDDEDLNEWISRINYASAFKSAGVKMRPVALSGDDIQLTGVAAATSHLHDIQKQISSPRTASWGSDAPRNLMDMLTSPTAEQQQHKRRITMSDGRTDLDLDVPTAPEVEGAEQFKATFDRVKADLASSWTMVGGDLSFAPSTVESPPGSPLSADSPVSRLPSRASIIQSKIEDLEGRLAPIRLQLEADTRQLRNVAILTPFKAATRTKLQQVVQNLAPKITQLRLEVEKLNCHRTVLHNDLHSEGRAWHQSRKDALRAAKETLQRRTLPRMTVSIHDEDHTLPRESLEFQDTSFCPSPQRPESSLSGSFHSATDSGFDWPSSDDILLVESLKGLPPRTTLSPQMATTISPPRRSTSSSSIGPRDILLNDGPIQRLPHRDSTGRASSSERSQEDEEAEEWNKTRCAKRVSLVQVPSSLKLSPTRLRKDAKS